MTTEKSSSPIKKTLDYDQAVNEICKWLQTLEWGDLTLLSHDLDIEYAVLNKLKNSKLPYQAPNVVKKLLQELYKQDVQHVRKHYYTIQIN